MNMLHAHGIFLILKFFRNQYLITKVEYSEHLSKSTSHFITISVKKIKEIFQNFNEKKKKKLSYACAYKLHLCRFMRINTYVDESYLLTKIDTNFYFFSFIFIHRSLKIANVHKILKINEENDPSAQIYAAEKHLTKIEEILNTHVKYNAVNVVSSNELIQLKNHMNILQSLKTNLKDVPNNAASKYQKNEELTKNLNQIVEFIESTGAKLNENLITIIENSSDVLN